MKIYTRTGDAGQTTLLGGERVPKSHGRVAAYGAVDELNAVLGLAASHLHAAGRGVAVPVDGRPPGPTTLELLQAIQDSLFRLGSELATPAGRSPAAVEPVDAAIISDLETAIDRMNERLPELKNFILPGGSVVAATLHLARTVCRRAERQTVALAASEPVRAEVLAYLNRLSDCLFVMARDANRAAGEPETLWRSDARGAS